MGHASRDTRALLRLPFGAFLIHLGATVLRRAVPVTAGAHRILGSLSLLFLLLSIGRSGVLLVVDVVLERRFLRPLPKITRDIVQGLVYAGIAMVTLRSAGVEPGSLLTTSALLTAVVGLSLQETLGNLFAGLAIQMQRPFDVGDWIQFDAEQKHIGRVLEINWRATKVLTLDEVEIIVPNGTLAKAPITNYTKPSPVSRRSIYVHTPYDVPPATVQETILAAIFDAPGVVRDPPPSVVTNLFADNGVEYWVRFFTDQFHKRDGVDGGVRDRIWYALRRAEIAIPYPAQTIDVRQIDDASHERIEARRFDELDGALRCVDFFQVLSAEDIRSLASMTTPPPLRSRRSGRAPRRHHQGALRHRARGGRRAAPPARRGDSVRGGAPRARKVLRRDGARHRRSPARHGASLQPLPAPRSAPGRVEASLREGSGSPPIE